jgi:uracil-DNA glycosylase
MSAKSDREARYHTTKAGGSLHCVRSLVAGRTRSIVQFSASATVLVIGQAPGAKVHASGVLWQDDSGGRLRARMGIGATTSTIQVKSHLSLRASANPVAENAEVSRRAGNALLSGVP